jgi:hypothetical protein
MSTSFDDSSFSIDQLGSEAMFDSATSQFFMDFDFSSTNFNPSYQNLQPPPPPQIQTVPVLQQQVTAAKSQQSSQGPLFDLNQLSFGSTELDVTGITGIASLESLSNITATSTASTTSTIPSISSSNNNNINYGSTDIISSSANLLPLVTDPVQQPNNNMDAAYATVDDALSFEQTQILETSFQQNPKPNKTRRIELANQTGISQQRIQAWFQRRRASITAAGNSIVTLQFDNYQLPANSQSSYSSISNASFSTISTSDSINSTATSLGSSSFDNFAVLKPKAAAVTSGLGNTFNNSQSKPVRTIRGIAPIKGVKVTKPQPIRKAPPASAMTNSIIVTKPASGFGSFNSGMKKTQPVSFGSQGQQLVFPLESIMKPTFKPPHLTAGTTTFDSTPSATFNTIAVGAKPSVAIMPQRAPTAITPGVVSSSGADKKNGMGKFEVLTIHQYDFSSKRFRPSSSSPSSAKKRK